jgi:hypothetical protein
MSGPARPARLPRRQDRPLRSRPPRAQDEDGLRPRDAHEDGRPREELGLYTVEHYTDKRHRQRLRFNWNPTVLQFDNEGQPTRITTRRDRAQPSTTRAHPSTEVPQFLQEQEQEQEEQNQGDLRAHLSTADTERRPASSRRFSTCRGMTTPLVVGPPREDRGDRSAGAEVQARGGRAPLRARQEKAGARSRTRNTPAPSRRPDLKRDGRRRREQNLVHSGGAPRTTRRSRPAAVMSGIRTEPHTSTRARGSITGISLPGESKVGRRSRRALGLSSCRSRQAG